MIFQLTAINCRISGEDKKHLNKRVQKIQRALADFAFDLIVVRLNIKKDIDRYYPPRKHLHKHKSYSDIKPALASFAGSLYLRVGKSWIYAHFKGQTIEECLSLGFERIFRELEKYKDTHFPSESEYPDKRSIRGQYGLGSFQ